MIYGSPAAPPGTVLPPGWNNGWKKARAAAAGGTGTAKIAFLGESWTCGQSTGTITDCLLYGYVGRLDSLLAGGTAIGGSVAANLGSYAEGYTLSGVNPGTLNSPSSPYGNTTIANVTNVDGGIGQLWGQTGGFGSTWLTITVPVHPVTGQAPVSVDLLTVDTVVGGTATWSYNLDGAGLVTISPAAGGNPTGPGTTGLGMFRRTSLTLTGAPPHTITLQASAANGLAFAGHIAYYGTSGLGIMRACIGGWTVINFATGGGTTASSTGGVSATPDHILPWAGVTPTSSPGLINNNIYASCAGGFPFNGVDLAVIHLGGNDCTQQTSPEAMRNGLTRMINALRRANPVTASSPGVSILFVGESYFSPYSDDSTSSTTNISWQKYKAVLFELSQQYGCGWLDLQQVFGETPVARGLTIASGAHPTQNGAGAGGGDGHLTIAQAIYGVL